MPNILWICYPHYFQQFLGVIDIRNNLNPLSFVKRMDEGEILEFYSDTLSKVHSNVKSRCHISYLKDFSIPDRVHSLSNEFGSGRVMELIRSEDAGIDPRYTPQNRHQSAVQRVLDDPVGFTSVQLLEASDNLFQTALAKELIKRGEVIKLWKRLDES